jgi:hypothetical protein
VAAGRREGRRGIAIRGEERRWTPRCYVFGSGSSGVRLHSAVVSDCMGAGPRVSDRKSTVENLVPCVPFAFRNDILFILVSVARLLIIGLCL